MNDRTAETLADWQGYLSRNEVAEIKRITQSVKGYENNDLVVVNIGAGAGTSTLSFIEARKDLIVFSVDILTTEAEITTNEHLRMAETGHDKDGRVIKVWGDSKVVGKRWPYPVDLLFIDGDHSYAGCMGDLVTWFSSVVPGDGYILVHDYGKNVWPDVKWAVDEFLPERAEFVSLTDTLIVFKVKE